MAGRCWRIRPACRQPRKLAATDKGSGDSRSGTPRRYSYEAFQFTVELDRNTRGTNEGARVERLRRTDGLISSTLRARRLHLVGTATLGRNPLLGGPELGAKSPLNVDIYVITLKHSRCQRFLRP